MAESDAKRTLDQAQAAVEALLDELAAEGISANGWDDEGIYLHSHRPEDQTGFRENERRIEPRSGDDHT
jgi:hypothetical protein